MPGVTSRRRVVDAILDGLATLDQLGAVPLARMARARLRALGVTSVPRGPREETRANLAGLTARQVEVLDLLRENLTNAQIAARLVLSVKTVDNHVAAVLHKLGVPNRLALRGSFARLTDRQNGELPRPR